TQAWQGNEGTVGEQVVLSAPPTLGTPSTSGYSSTTAYGSSGYSSSSSSASAYSGQAYQLLSGNPDAVVIIDDLNGFPALAPALAAQPSWDPANAWGGDQLVSPALPALVSPAPIDAFPPLA